MPELGRRKKKNGPGMDLTVPENKKMLKKLIRILQKDTGVGSLTGSQWPNL